MGTFCISASNTSPTTTEHDSAAYCCPAAADHYAMRVQTLQQPSWRAPPPRVGRLTPAAIIPAAPPPGLARLVADRGVPALRHAPRGRMTAVRRARTQRSVRRGTAREKLGNSELPGWAGPMKPSPVVSPRLVDPPPPLTQRLRVGLRRAATRGWSPADLRLAALRVIVRPHSQYSQSRAPTCVPDDRHSRHGSKFISLFGLSGPDVGMLAVGGLMAWLGCLDRDIDFTELAKLKIDPSIHVEQKKSCIVYLKECWSFSYSTCVTLPARCKAPSHLCFVDILKRVRMILLLTPTP